MENQTIDNCQLLGTAFGRSADEARIHLENNCPWIKNCGYDINKVISKQLLSEENKRDINMLSRYLEDIVLHYQQEAGVDNQMYKIWYD